MTNPTGPPNAEMMTTVTVAIEEKAQQNLQP